MRAARYSIMRSTGALVLSSRPMRKPSRLAGRRARKTLRGNACPTGEHSNMVDSFVRGGDERWMAEEVRVELTGNALAPPAGFEVRAPHRGYRSSAKDNDAMGFSGDYARDGDRPATPGATL